MPSTTYPGRATALAAILAGGAVAAIITAAAAARQPIAAATWSPKPAAPVRASARPVQPAPAGDEPAHRFGGRVGDNLTASLIAAGVPERAGREYVAVLSRAIDLKGGLSVDDKFDLVVERLPGGGWGRLLYAGLDRVARADVELLKWTDGKSTVWVNADAANGEVNAGFAMPVHGRLTSAFGNRFHPILGYVRFHDGVDLAAPAGTPVAAAADGRVVSAGWHGGYGRQVEIAHAGGFETSYGHMSALAAYPGELVRQGQVIGYVGSTGLSTGPHLHFEVIRGGRPVNPLSVKFGGGPGQLEGEKLRAFQATLRSLLLLPGQG